MGRRIGLLGGTFNPIHIGHLEMARAAQEALHLDEMILMPDGDPPHKTPDGATKYDRLRMTELAAAGCFTVSALEVEREGKTYTVDTLEEMRAQGAGDIYMLIGADTLRELPTWRDPPRLFRLCTFAAFGRAGCAWPQTPEGAHVVRLEAEIPGVSSTEIRRRVAAGLSVEGMVPQTVLEYMGAKRLYNPPPLLSDEEMRRRLQQTLRPERYAHVLGVEETARLLAKQYGVNEAQAALAGLLHDCAKVYDHAKTLAWADAYEVDRALLPPEIPAIWHGPVGEAVAHAEYGVTDAAVLHAIRIHTTGCENMSPLDKVLYVADLTEPGRRYSGVDEIRACARESLDSALLASMRQKLAYLKRTGGALDPSTSRALSSMMKNAEKNTGESAET